MKVSRDPLSWLDQALPITIGLLFVIIFLYLLFSNPHITHADELSSPAFKGRAVNAIIGEAEGEPYRGKLAVACAIRNRDTLKGVYGEKAPRVLQHKYNAKTFVDADMAWEESAHPENCEFIKGATHWEGTKFPKPYWATVMVKTVVVGNQAFYRPPTEDEDTARRISFQKQENAKRKQKEDSDLTNGMMWGLYGYCMSGGCRGIYY